MSADIDLFFYINRESPVHRLHPVAKLIIYFTLNFVIFYINILGLVLLLPGIVLLFAVSGIGILYFIKRLRFLAVFFIFVIIMMSVDYDPHSLFSIRPAGIVDGLVFSLRLAASFLSGGLFLSVTRVIDLQNVITAVIRLVPPLRRKDPGFYVGLAVYLIPVMLRECRITDEALKARGGNRIKNPIKRIKLVIIPFLIRSINSAFGITDAVIARSNPSIPRRIYLSPMKLRDYVIMSSCLSVLITVMICNPV